MQSGDRLRRRIHPRRRPRQGDLGAQPDARRATAPSMAARCAAEAKIASFAGRASSRPAQPFAVVDGTGKPIGEVTPQAVIDLLAGSERREPAHDGDGKRQRGEAAPGSDLAAGLGRGACRRACRCSCCSDSLPWAVNYPAERDRPGRRLDQRADGLDQVEPVLADALDHRGARRAARSRAQSAGQEFQDRPRRRRRSSCRACPGSASCAAAFLAGHAARRPASSAAGRRLLPLHRAVRPVDQRHADAGADLHRRAVLHRHRACSLGIWAWRKPWAERLHRHRRRST